MLRYGRRSLGCSVVAGYNPRSKLLLPLIHSCGANRSCLEPSSLKVTAVMPVTQASRQPPVDSGLRAWKPPPSGSGLVHWRSLPPEPTTFSDTLANSVCSKQPKAISWAFGSRRAYQPVAACLTSECQSIDQLSWHCCASLEAQLEQCGAWINSWAWPAQPRMWGKCVAPLSLTSVIAALRSLYWLVQATCPLLHFDGPESKPRACGASSDCDGIRSGWMIPWRQR